MIDRAIRLLSLPTATSTGSPDAVDPLTAGLEGVTRLEVRGTPQHSLRLCQSRSQSTGDLE